MQFSQSEFELPDPGVHTGTAYIVAYIGKQKKIFEGKESIKPHMVVVFETPETFKKDGTPFSVSKEYTVSKSDKSALAKDFKSWQMKKLESADQLFKLCGQSCNLNISHSEGEKTWPRIEAITPLKASEKRPDYVYPQVLFDLDDYREANFQALPEWLQNKIKESVDYEDAIRGQSNKDIPANHPINDNPPIDYTAAG